MNTMRGLKKYFNKYELDIILQIMGEGIEIRDRLHKWKKHNPKEINRREVLKAYTKIRKLEH